MHDIVIAGGRVIDAETDLDRICNVGIRDGKIASISAQALHGRKTIDAAGCVVSPGFIDAHIHEDNMLQMVGSGYTVHPTPVETATALLRAGVTSTVGGNCGISAPSVSAYLQGLSDEDLPCNYGTLVGYNTLREINSGDTGGLKAACEAGLYEGAFGVSFGLQYCPDIQSSEVLEVAEIVERRDRFIAAHLRYDDPQHAGAAMGEIVDVVKRSGVRVQVSHIAANIYSDDNLRSALTIMAELNDEGFDIRADAYPYDAWGTTIKSEVFSAGWDSRYSFTYEDIEIATGPHAGRRCTRELFRKLREQKDNAVVVCHNAIPETDIRTAYLSDDVFAVSDGSLSRDPHSGRLQGHPRTAGTAPRVLGRLVREWSWLSLDQAIAKLTSAPAVRLGLANKGRLQLGADADITVFDPQTIRDNSEFGLGVCAACPTGILDVIVDGKVAIERGKLKNRGLGAVLTP